MSDVECDAIIEVGTPRGELDCRLHGEILSFVMGATHESPIRQPREDVEQKIGCVSLGN